MWHELMYGKLCTYSDIHSNTTAYSCHQAANLPYIIFMKNRLESILEDGFLERGKASQNAAQAAMRPWIYFGKVIWGEHLEIPQKT